MIPPEHHIDLRDGRLFPPNGQNLPAMFAALEASPARDHLLIHFHGGLVSRSDAETSALILMPYYDAASTYPVFFFWRSDILSMLTGNLGQVAQEPMFQRLVKRLVQLAVGKLVMGGLATRSVDQLQLPPDEAVPDDPTLLAEYADRHEPKGANFDVTPLSDQQAAYAEDKLKDDPVIQSESLAIAASNGAAVPAAAPGTRGAPGPKVVPRVSRISPAIQQELVYEATSGGHRTRGGLLALLTIAKHAVLILRRVINRFSSHHDHGLYATIVEEVLREFYAGDLGTGVWNLIKQDTLDSFGQDPAVFGGTAFLEQVRQWWRPGRRITLVGHSTGALYIGHFLEKADAVLPAQAKLDFVFLAPACTFDFMAERLSVFKKRVRRKLSFGLSDQIERNYWEVPVLFRGSLLYMVSGLFEAPDVDRAIVGMQRYFSGQAPYQGGAYAAVVQYFGGDLVWSRTVPGSSWSSFAAKHSDVDNDVPTLESVRAFISAPGPA